MAPRQRILEEGAAIRVRGCSSLYLLGKRKHLRVYAKMSITTDTTP